MRDITEGEIIEALTNNGQSLDDYFLLDGDLPGHYNERGELMALVIEDDDLAGACLEYLRRRGAPIVEPGHGA